MRFSLKVEERELLALLIKKKAEKGFTENKRVVYSPTKDLQVGVICPETEKYKEVVCPVAGSKEKGYLPFNRGQRRTRE